MTTNTPITQGTYQLTQSGEEVQELLDLIGSMSEEGYTELEDLIDVIENWDVTDDGESFKQQLTNVLSGFLNRNEVLGDILATGETEQTQINGKAATLDSSLPVASSVIHDELLQWRINEFSTSRTYGTTQDDGSRTLTYNNLPNAKEGLYLYPYRGGTEEYAINSIKINLGNSKTLGGTLMTDSVSTTVLNPDESAIVKIEADKTIVLFKTKRDKSFLQQEYVEELPTDTHTNGFTSSSETQFVSSSRCTVSLTTHEGKACQQITTGNNAANTYAMATYSLPSFMNSILLRYIVIEFDSYMTDGARWWLSLVDRDQRPGSNTGGVTLDSTGIFFSQGINNASQNYAINGVNINEYEFLNTWVHSYIKVDTYEKTVSYNLTNEAGKTKTGTLNYYDTNLSRIDANYLNGIEIYSWTNNTTMYFTNLSVIATDGSVDSTKRYIILPEDSESGNIEEYVFSEDDMMMYQLGSGDITSDDYVLSVGKDKTMNDVDLNTLITNGIYSVTCSGQTQSEQCNFPQITYNSSTRGSQKGSLIVAENDDGCNQLYINYGMGGIVSASQQPIIAYRTINTELSPEPEPDADWIIIDGDISDMAVISDTDTEPIKDLNTLTKNGFYSVAISSSQGATYHFPSYNGVYWESGVVIVGQYDEGCTQLFLNWGKDGDNTDMYTPALAYRTLNKGSGDTYTVNADWKIIYPDSESSSGATVEEVVLSECRSGDYGSDIDQYTVFDLFPDLTLNTLFVLNNDVSSYTSSAIYIDDEKTYVLDATIQSGTVYLAEVTKKAVAGVDGHNGNIHIYGALFDGTIDTDDIADGAVNEAKLDTTLNGELLRKTMVSALPSTTVSYNFDDSNTRFTAVERCTLTIQTEGSDKYLHVTTGNNTMNKYALSQLNLTDIGNSANTFAIEMDTRIPASRWYISLVDLTKRPGDSYRTTYDNSGVAFSCGTTDGSNYNVNGTTVFGDSFVDTWLHMRLDVDIETKKVKYDIQNRSTNTTLATGTVNFNDSATDKITGIELYSYLNDTTLDIDNIKVTAGYDIEENQLYFVDGGGTYAYFDNEPVEIGGGSAAVEDGSITTVKLANGSVTSAKTSSDIVKYTDTIPGGSYLVSDCLTCAETADAFLFPTDFQYPTQNKNSMPKIIDEVYNKKIGTADITDKSITAAKLADGVIPSAGLMTYSTTPQQIGTWIDGTPVWRIAFDNDYTESEKSNEYVSWSTLVGEYVTNTNNAAVINAFGMSRWGSSPCVIDDAPMTFEGNSFAIPYTQHEGYYGYIDILTVESNLKS